MFFFLIRQLLYLLLDLTMIIQSICFFNIYPPEFTPYGGGLVQSLVLQLYEFAGLKQGVSFDGKSWVGAERKSEGGLSEFFFELRLAIVKMVR